MGIPLKAGETVMFPAPYVPNENYPLIITTARLVEVLGGEAREMELKKLIVVSRAVVRKFAMVAALFVMIGLGLVGLGATIYVPVYDLPSFKEKPLAEDEPQIEDPAITRIKGMVAAGAGALSLLVAWKLFGRKRYLVLCQSANQKMRIKTKDEGQQTQIVLTLNALQQQIRQINQQ